LQKSPDIIRDLLVVAIQKLSTDSCTTRQIVREKKRERGGGGGEIRKRKRCVRKRTCTRESEWQKGGGDGVERGLAYDRDTFTDIDKWNK